MPQEIADVVICAFPEVHFIICSAVLRRKNSNVNMA